MFEQFGGAAVVVVGRVGGVGDEQHAFDIGQGRARVFDERFAQTVLRLVNAGRIQKDELKLIAAVQNAGNAMARGFGGEAKR